MTKNLNCIHNGLGNIKNAEGAKQKGLGKKD